MQFVCQNCFYVSPKWLGRCPSCGEWNTFIEDKREFKKEEEKKFKKPVPLSISKRVEEIRINVGISALDSVFGGGIVKGAYYLLGGEPGIGKSTLLLQISGMLSKMGYKVLYVSGEESDYQVKMRADRLNINQENIYIVCAHV